MIEKKVLNGWTRVENEWLEGVMIRDLSGSELRVLLCVLRQTVGYNRDSAELSIAAVAGFCSMSARTAEKALNRLATAGVIERAIRGQGRPALLRIQALPKKEETRLPKKEGDVSPKKRSLSLEKENIKKESLNPLFFEMSKWYHDEIKKAHPSLTAGLTERADTAGAGVLEKLVRIDGHSTEYVKKVLEWALTDKFWALNMRSLASARNKSKNGSTKFENCAAQYEMTNPAPAATGADRQDGGSIYGHMTDDEMRAYAERIRPNGKAGGKNAGQSWQGL